MAEGYYDPGRILTTERLRLVPLCVGMEGELWSKIVSDPLVTRYYLFDGIRDEHDPGLTTILTGYSARRQYAFAITDRISGEFFGIIHQTSSMNDYFPKVDVGYAIGSSYWNRGIMTEALRAFIGLLFEKGVHKVTADHITENTASGRVMEKCGMRCEGIKRSELRYRGRYYDFRSWYILNPADAGTRGTDEKDP